MQFVVPNVACSAKRSMCQVQRVVPVMLHLWEVCTDVAMPCISKQGNIYCRLDAASSSSQEASPKHVPYVLFLFADHSAGIQVQMLSYLQQGTYKNSFVCQQPDIEGMSSRHSFHIVIRSCNDRPLLVQLYLQMELAFVDCATLDSISIAKERCWCCYVERRSDTHGHKPFCLAPALEKGSLVQARSAFVSSMHRPR